MTRFSQDGGEKYRSFCLTERKGNSFVPINGGFVGHGKMVSVVGWLDKGEVSLFVGRFVFVAFNGKGFDGAFRWKCFFEKFLPKRCNNDVSITMLVHATINYFFVIEIRRIRVRGVLTSSNARSYHNEYDCNAWPGAKNEHRSQQAEELITSD